MTAPSRRIAPLEPPFTDPVAEDLRKMMGNKDNPPPLALFRTMMTVPDLGSRIRPLGGYFLSKGALGPRQRELVIHRVTARYGAEYEWGVHAVLFAERLGLSRDWLQATLAADPLQVALADDEVALARAVDQLIATGSIDDAAYAQLEEHLTPGQILEFLMLVGWYAMISFVANGARVELEDWALRFTDVQSDAVSASAAAI